MKKQNENVKQRIMSGMRPTGKLHLGHYFGVLINWVKFQKEYDCCFAIADWHALTTKFDKTDDLKQNILEAVMDWLACGINPEQSTIYVQSLVPETAELSLYLGMITPQNWVERDPTLKDMAKILKNKEGSNNQISYGLMGYPVLMSADIMTFNASVVPVGSDQLAHLEITRDIARRFNYIYKTNFFNEPVPKLTQTPLLCGLDGNKMGKSFNNDIKISDDEDTTAKKVMQAITDRSRARKDDPGHPDQCEVAFKYWQIFGCKEIVDTVENECKQGLRGCADCKKQLGCVINEKLSSIRERRRYYENNIEEVVNIIENGSEKARIEARKVLTEVRKLVKMY